MNSQGNLRCEYLLITDGKDETQMNAHIVKDTLGTLYSKPRVLIRNIYDQGNQKDKIMCKKVVFVLYLRMSLLKLVRDWLYSLKGIKKRNKNVLVLILKLDTEDEDQTPAVDDTIAAIKNENGIERIESVSNFKDLASWWPAVMKFLMEVKVCQEEIVSYKLKIEISKKEASKLSETLLGILSRFGLEENDSSDNIVKINKRNENEETYSDSARHGSTYIFKKSGNSELSKALLAMLLDLKVIQAEETKHTNDKVNAYLESVLFCVLFLLSCIMNVPVFALYVSFTFGFPWNATNVCTIIIYPLFTKSCNKHLFTFLNNIFACIMFGILSFVLWKIEFRISILIAIYTIFWPVIFNDFLVFSYGFDYGVASFSFELWGKINFGLIRFLHRFLNSVRRNSCISFINAYFKVIFTLIHIPFILLYYILFVPLLLMIKCNRTVRCLFTFYTNFTLSLGSFVGGCYLLFNERKDIIYSPQIPTDAIVLFLISIYIFFFLCICHIYCWRNLGMTYRILTSQVKLKC